MKRREFISQSCKALIAIPIGVGLSSCEGIYYVTNHHIENDLATIPFSEFQIVKEGKTKLRKYVLLNTEKYKFPICIYRTGKNKFTSSLLECTHQGCELNVAAGAFNCPCHGSEFSTKGEVLEGPAEHNLKTFQTKSDEKYIYVTL